MSRKATVHPPNCEVRNSERHKFLLFIAKRDAVRAEYGFTLCHPRRTPEEREGYRRYMRDWRKRYREAHHEEVLKYQRKYRRETLQKGFKNKAEASGDAKRLKILAAMKEGKDKRKRLDEHRREVFEKYGFWLGKKPQTPEEIAGHKRYKSDYSMRYAKEHKAKADESQKRYREKQRLERERIFEERMRELEATDPAAAKKARATHELLCKIQRMTPEELVKYREVSRTRRRELERKRRKEKRKATSAERKRLKAEAKRKRKAELAAARKAAKLARERVRREKREQARLARKEAAQAARKPSQAELRRVREAKAAAQLAVDRELEEQYRLQREANIRAYLERKARRDEVGGMGDEPEPQPPVASEPPPVVPPDEPPVWLGGDDEDDGDFGDNEDNDDNFGDEPEDIEEAHRRLEEEARQRVAEEREARREARRRERLVAEVREKANAHADAAIAYALKYPIGSERRTGRQTQRINITRRKIEDALNAEIERQAQVGVCAKRAEWQRIVAALIADVDAKQKEQSEARARHRAEVLEKYGFILGKKPTTPEEIEGRRRYARDLEAAERERHRERIRAYNSEYRRKQRAKALAEEQTAWTEEQWEAWRKLQASRECPQGSPQWLIREVVRRLAKEQNISEDDMMTRLIEHGGIDYLSAGADSIGRRRCTTKGMVQAAINALKFYLDPDHAEMFEG